ncbi:MAG: hypothetical protein ACOC6C_04630, partial [Verrucomicrobiota bacterium]
MNSEAQVKMFAEAVAQRDTSALVSEASKVAARIGPDAASLLASLGFIGRIAINPWVKTAMIERRQANFTIRFGDAFLKDQVGNIRDFSYVLAHELLHLTLNHLIPRKVDSRFDPFVFQETTDLDDVSYKQTVEEVACDMEVCKALHAIWGPTPDIVYRDREKGIINGLMATPEVVLGEKWETGDPLCENDIFFKFCKRCSQDQLYIETLKVAELTNLYKEFWESSEMSSRDLAGALEPLLLPLRWQLVSRPLEFVLIRVSTNLTEAAGLSDSMLSRLSPKLSNMLKKMRSRNKQKGGSGSFLVNLDIENPVDTKLMQAIASILRQQLPS